MISRYAALFLFAAGALSSPAQSEVTGIETTEIVKTDSAGYTSVGFNALNYVLQKPNSNRYFEHKKFGDRLFMSIEGGASWFMNPVTTFNSPGTDYRVGVSLGDWVTPVHGWRFGLNAGRHHLSPGHHPAFGGVSLDYVANLSGLVRGANMARKFEVIAAAGVEYQLSRHCHHNNNIFGARVGLQGRWNFARNLYAYIEPRMGLYFGPGIYKGIPGANNFRYRLEPSFLVGLGFRRLTAEEKAMYADPFEARNVAENMFYELSGGWNNIRTAYRKMPNGKSGLFSDHYVTFSFAGGKWFSPYSAVRLAASYGKMTYSKDYFMGGIDYVWNITNAINGYRVYSPFELDLSLGFAAAYVSQVKAKVYPGFEFGVKAMVNINSNWGIFIEPQGRMFGNNFRNEVASTRVMPSLSLGLRYSIGDYKYDYAENLENFKSPDAKRQFMTLNVGPAKYKQGTYGIGYALELGYGRWFSPMSAWKVGIDAQIFPKSSSHFRNMSFGADYILSISSALAGFNPHRFFDFSGSLGGYIGFAHCDARYKADSTTRFTGSVKAAFIGTFRLTDQFGLQVQTQAIGGGLPIAGGSYEMRPEMRLMVGAKYQF